MLNELTGKTLSYKIARAVSTLLVPPAASLLAFTYLAFNIETDIRKIWIAVIVNLIFGFIAPISMFIYLRRKGRIIDQDATIKEERELPFFIAVLFYVIGALILICYNVNVLITAFWICYITNTLIVLVINKFWKISVHSIGVSGSIGALMYAFGINFLSLIPIALLVGWSRIKLNKHTFAQVAAGIIFGFIFTYYQIDLLIRALALCH